MLNPDARITFSKLLKCFLSIDKFYFPPQISFGAENPWFYASTCYVNILILFIEIKKYSDLRRIYSIYMFIYSLCDVPLFESVTHIPRQITSGSVSSEFLGLSSITSWVSCWWRCLWNAKIFPSCRICEKTANIDEHSQRITYIKSNLKQVDSKICSSDVSNFFFNMLWSIFYSVR